MTISDESPTLHELLKHDAWLRRLAHALVGSSDAEDLVQETWLAAATRPPKGDSRPWLGAVARRLAAQSRRRRGRIARREAAAARPEALPSTEETLQALAVQREVTEALDSLAEPFRTAVLLRYHHELDYAEIAARAGSTQATARQRVSRGLERIRARLAERHGADWRHMPGVALLCGIPDAITNAATAATTTVATGGAVVPESLLLVGSLAMSKLFLGAAALAVCVFLGWFAFGDPEQVTMPVSDAGSIAAVDSGRDAAADGEATVQRQAVRSVDAASQVASGAASTQRIEGRVVDPQGQPVAGVPIVRRTRAAGSGESASSASRQVAVSGPDGAFAVEIEEASGELSGGAPWCSLTVCRLEMSEEAWSVLLVVSEAVQVAGVVVAAPQGGPEVPLPGAVVRPLMQKLLTLPLATDRAERVRWPSVQTDEDGRFSFSRLPAVGQRLAVSMRGYERQVVDVDGSRELRIVMRPADPASLEFVGTVRLPDGRIAPSGVVGHDGKTASIDEEGRYRLRLNREVLGAGTFFAAAPGYQAAVVADPLGDAVSLADGTYLLDLTLSDAARTISGTVRNAKGQPWPGVLVYPWMPETFVDTQLLEDHSQLSHHEESDVISGLRTFAVTGADGSFTLRGLRNRTYDLRFFHTETFTNIVRKEVSAGTRGLVVEFPADACLAELDGVVEDPAGNPVVGARVRHMVSTREDEDGIVGAHYASDTRTDDEGRFHLEKVPTSGCRIVVEHADHVRVEVEPGRDGVLRVELPRRCHVRVDVASSYPAAVRWQAFDRAGQVLALFQIESRASSWRRAAELDAGRSEVLQVSERAVTIELRDRGGEVIARLPVRLMPGEVTTVR